MEDFRVDAADRLRAIGHSQQAVTKPCANAPTIRGEKRKAVIGNAMRNTRLFSVAGNDNLSKHKRYGTLARLKERTTYGKVPRVDAVIKVIS